MSIHKIILYLLMATLVPLQVSAQVSISGRILNDASGEPIADASVYINNTTIGATTNAAGDYELRNVKNGIYEIIVSHISFDVLVHRIEVKDQSLRFTFRLQPEVKQMRNILVMTSGQRKRWMAVFREYFLGQTQSASRTRIVNEEDVFFEKGPDKGSIMAFAEVPLIVENRDLGYRIHFDLQEFYFDSTIGKTWFLGFSRFGDLGGNVNRWKRRRTNNYRGSTMHFYHALLEDKLSEEKFDIFLRQDKEMIMPDGSVRKSAIAIPVTRKEILFRDSLPVGVKNYLKWNGVLTVRYNRDPYGKEYLKKKLFMTGLLPVGFQSGISMLESPAWLDSNGVLENPLAVQYSGYWSFERLANMLPIDFRPEK